MRAFDVGERVKVKEDKLPDMLMDFTNCTFTVERINGAAVYAQLEGTPRIYIFDNDELEAV